MHHAPHRFPSRVVTRLLLLVALAVASLTLTHCRMVGDRLTGVEVGPLRRSSECLRRCKREYKDAIKAEDRLHRERRHACRGDDECLEEERRRHDAAEDAIEAAYRACKAGCHHQGGGGDDD